MLTKYDGASRITTYSKYDNLFKLTNSKVVDLSKVRESKTLGFTKTAGKTVEVAPHEQDFIYIRSRAVSAGNVIDHKDGKCELIPIDTFYAQFAKYAPICRGANINGDFFSHEELKRTYKTFIGKSVFVDHNNENVADARGIILDAIYNETGYFVEILEAVDKKAFPQLANAIEKRYITDTSMGCRCGKARCSICGNIAQTEDELCEHVLNYKGLTFNGLPVFEDNYEVEFFEDSIVTEGADHAAKIMERVASKTPRSGVQKQNYYSKKVNEIANEKNQRTLEGRINNLSNELSNLWE